MANALSSGIFCPNRCQIISPFLMDCILVQRIAIDYQRHKQTEELRHASLAAVYRVLMLCLLT